MLFKLAGRHRIKRLGPFTFKIDRPKGFVKTWGSKSFTYPCDYGYFPGVKGEDGEALDAFVGDDLSGRMESFLKLKKDQSGNLVPDETKFLVGVSDKDAKKIYALYGDEVSQRVTYESVDALKAAVREFKPMKKGRYESVEEKTAGFKKLPRSTQALMVTPAALLSAYGLYRGGKAMVDHFSPREEEIPTKLAATQVLERFGIKAASAKTADLYKKLLGEIMARKRGKTTEKTAVDTKLGAAELAYKLAPSLANAYDAYQATSAALDAQKEQEERMRFPALHATQPERMMNAMYGMDPSSTGSFDSPPVHHRRHRRQHH